MAIHRLKRGVSSTTAGALAWLVAAVCWLSGCTEPLTPQQQAEQAAQAAACAADLQCQASAQIIAAGVYCAPEIERLSAYAVRWTNAWPEKKMSRFRWLDQGQGTITYFGDQVLFQNGFGAERNYVYECDFDPAKHLVLAVRVRPGRLE